MLFCIADGMGGLRNGALLSNAAAAAVAREFPLQVSEEPERLVLRLVQCASHAVNSLITADSGSGGTTLVLGYLRDGALRFASVGDSRICLCRGGVLYPLNRQHSFSGELSLAAVNGELSFEEAASREKQNALTSYLGMGPLKYLDRPDAPIPVQRGDTILVMSDGVFHSLSDSELTHLLRGPVTSLARKLAEGIEEKNLLYQDNYSAVLLRLE